MKFDLSDKKRKNKNEKWTIRLMYFFMIISIVLLFAVLPLTEKIQNLEKEVKNEVIYSYYYLKDGIHKTTYYPYNHSYTINKPFTCDNITYYGEFENYLENCGGSQ